MKKSVIPWQIGGFLFTAVAGTLLHFLFDWTGGSPVAALFSAVNESIWEHLKLLFYPMVLFAVAEYFAWGREVPSFWCVKLMGILTGLLLVPVAYYTYTGISGANADWLNITLFFIGAAASFWTETKLFQKGFSCPLDSFWAIVLLCLIAAFFTVFTFLPPHIPFFQDPQTGTYGFQD